MVDTVKVSVIARAGNIVVFSFQLASNTGTFQLEVHVSLVAAVHKLAESAGVYPRAVVTSLLSIPVINQLSLFKSDTLVGISGVFIKFS